MSLLRESWQKNEKVERTSPESKNHWKITYHDGQEKWTDDYPGDGKGGERQKRLQERKQSRPSIQDAKETLDTAVKKYVKGDSTEKELAGVVDDVVVHVGREVARETIRGYIKDHKDRADEKTKEAHKILNDRQVAKLRKKEAMINQIADKIAGEVELKEVFEWVKKQSTWLDWELDGDTLLGSTRDNGRRGDEDEAGPEDIREAKRMRELIRGQFKDAVVFELDTDDEWTNLSIRLNPRARKSNERVADMVNQYDNISEAVGVTGDSGYATGGTQIWYAKDAFTRDSFMGYDWLERKGLLPDEKNLRATHTFVGKIQASNPGKVFAMMQGEMWSPSGEANTMLRRKGLGHTSMSVGDIMVIGSKALLVDMVGFKELGAARNASIVASEVTDTTFSQIISFSKYLRKAAGNVLGGFWVLSGRRDRLDNTTIIFSLKSEDRERYLETVGGKVRYDSGPDTYTFTPFLQDSIGKFIWGQPISDWYFDDFSDVSKLTHIWDRLVKSGGVQDGLTSREAGIASRIVQAEFLDREAEKLVGERVEPLLRALEGIHGVESAEIEDKDGEGATIKVVLKFKSKNEHGEETMVEPEVDPKVIAGRIKAEVSKRIRMSIHTIELPKWTGETYDNYYIKVYLSVRP